VEAPPFTGGESAMPSTLVIPTDGPTDPGG